jgi:DNA-binding NtrC family response regulator
MPHAERIVRTSEPLLAGSSPAVRRLSEEIESVAAAPCVLIESEAGLETDIVAGAIHAQSRRAGRLVTVECRGVKPPLVERLLFGGTRRTSRDLDAVAADSALAQADGGTLYLGNVCELSPAAQSRLVRIARGDAMRIDGGAASARVSLVAATTTDLQARVDEGQFHADLLEQFSQARIAVPGLRRRVEDLPVIIDALLAEQCAAAGVSARVVTAPAMSLLSSMPWPGNLVELRHAIAQLVGATSCDSIDVQDVLAHVHFHAALAPHSASGTLRAARRQFERDYIALILRQHHGRVGDAARALGIQRTNLYRKARQLGISVARPVQC